MSISGWEEQARRDVALCTYQLDIEIAQEISVQIGRLGRFRFAAGHYRYTGSATRNLIARVRRHLSTDKRLRWHVDYLLAAKGVCIVDVTLSAQGECECNRQVAGDIIVGGFGASDCRSGCGSHLKFLG